MLLLLILSYGTFADDSKPLTVAEIIAAEDAGRFHDPKHSAADGRRDRTL